MMKHFVLNLNPTAQFEWERCVLQHPITAEQPNFADLIADSVTESIHEGRSPMAGTRPSGSYLIAVKLEVTILESHISESIPETIPDSFPSSIAIPFVETERVIERVNELRSRRPTLQGLKVS